jgi:hypothetical protein
VATCLICVGALLPVLSSQMNSSDGVAAATKFENDQVKAALAMNQRSRTTLAVETPANRLRASVASTH